MVDFYTRYLEVILWGEQDDPGDSDDEELQTEEKTPKV